MSISKKPFGTFNGEQIFSYTLDNKRGLSAEILNYGGIIRRLIYKNTDIVLGYDTLSNYVIGDEYFGAIIGRNAHSIENARFTLNGICHNLSANSGRHNHHGGKCGFDKKVWNVKTTNSTEPQIVLSYTSPDGEEGFPGKVEAQVTYTLTSDNALKIHYEGLSDADTVLNMTNHSYFNLNGHASGKIDGHSLWLASDFFTPINEACIPDGEILSVKETPFDFSVAKTFDEGFSSHHPQIKLFDGFDHNFALKGDISAASAVLKGEKTGIVMELYTDQKGVQIYTANDLKLTNLGKNGVTYEKHGAVCMETQAFPNCMKFSHFPSSILKKYEKYSTTTYYKFI